MEQSRNKRNKEKIVKIIQINSRKIMKSNRRKSKWKLNSRKSNNKILKKQIALHNFLIQFDNVNK